jgi:hypothetical protein
MKKVKSARVSDGSTSSRLISLLMTLLDLRFADMNGDGRDDFLFVDMLNGSVTAWYNGGQIPSSGSAFQWNWQGVVSPGGSCRGQCIEFGQEYGIGRDDYISMIISWP